MIFLNKTELGGVKNGGQWKHWYQEKSGSFLASILFWGLIAKRYLFLYNNKIKRHQNDDITKTEVKNVFCVCLHLAAIYITAIEM